MSPRRIAITLRAPTAADRASGQVLVIFALFLVALLGISAVAVDYGGWQKSRREYQNAADGAAIAGSAFLTRPIDAAKRTLAREAAWRSLRDQLGLSVDPAVLRGTDTPAASPVLDAGYRIWVSTPPIGAGGVTAARYPGTRTSTSERSLFVWVERDNPSFFARVVGVGDRTMSAWATAGLFPNRYAVITLRRQGQAGPSDAENIRLAGTNAGLEVIDGDVGGNWAMKLTADSHLWLRSAGSNDSDVYLTDHVSCGASCWNIGQINSGPLGSPANQNKPAQQLPNPIADPNYPLPGAISAAPGSPASPALPLGDQGGNVDVRSGGPNAAPGGTSVVGGVLTCDPASPRIGPGYYSDIAVAAGKCLIFDPTARHSSITAATPDVASPLPAGQLPGIFYVNGSVDVDNGGMIVGDGVSLFIRPHATSNTQNRLTVSAGGVVNLNRGLVTPNRQRGAWTVKGTPTYTCDASMNCVYNTALNAAKDETGVALYVIKREQFASVAADDNSDVIKINASGGLAWNGVTYAPHDNVELAGQPGHDGVGQLVSWTFKFAGGTNVVQQYDGEDRSTPRLLEPTLGQ